MARFAFISISILSVLAALTNVGAVPIGVKRTVTQTAANFKELESVQLSTY